MAYEIPLERLTFIAGADLSAKQYFAVKLANTGKVVLAGAGESAIGVVQNTPVAEEASTIMTLGITMAKSGGSITAGQNVTPDAAGKFVVAAGGNAVIGVALTNAVADDVFPMLLSVKSSAGTYNLEADSVNTAAIEDNAVTIDKIAAGFMKVAKVALTPAAAADDILFAWENEEAGAVIVHKVLVDITTAGGTATALIDVGGAADAVTGSDTLIDGADLNAVAVYDNIDDQGTNGKSKVKVAAGAFVTGQAKVEAAAALVGNAYIFYTAV